MLSRVCVVAAFTGLLNAAYAYDHWSPAGPGDVRSSCPGLNALANHGLIPRNGKGLTVDNLTQVVVEVYNFDEKFARFFSEAGLAVSPNPNGTRFDLDQINKHQGIEHDASLSRADYHEGGDATSFSWKAWSTVLAAFGGKEMVTVKTAAYARRARLRIESHRDPKFNITGQEYSPYADTAIYLAAMGDPITGNAKLSYVRDWFEKERLPTHLGWRKPSTPITFSNLESLVDRIAKVTGEDPGPIPFPTS